MTFVVRKAERKKARLKLGISGPSGSGKTYSALQLAVGLAKGDWNRVTLIDTENGSGELYSKMGPYNVIPFDPPFDPRRYVQAIEAATLAESDVIVIDSISHEWDGKGGCLDIQTKLGGRYTDWARVTPLHNAFVSAILQAPAHVIVTTRKKQDYDVSTESGKTKVQKVGLKEIQREGFEYELTINFDVEMSHFATASKDRTGLFMPCGPFQITPDTGKELVEWADGGAVEPAGESSVSADLSQQLKPLPQEPAELIGNPSSSQPPTLVNSQIGNDHPVVSVAQIKRLYAICKANNWNEATLKRYIKDSTGLDSAKALNYAEYNNICKYIEHHPMDKPFIGEP